MKDRILITPRSLTQSGSSDLDPLRIAGYALIFAQPGKTPSEKELLDLLPGCVGWLAGVEPISEKVLEAAKNLKVISRNGAGIDNIPIEAAKRLGIQVVRADGANAQGVAELTLYLALAALRYAPLLHQKLKQGGWERIRGREIQGRTIGLIGCGAVGRTVARLAIGLRARVTAYDPLPDFSFRPEGDFVWSSFDEVIEQADIVSLHSPPPPHGRPVIDAEVLSRFREQACLVNTARGSLIDENAVIDSLDSGRLSVYAADVFSSEPPDPNSALLKHKRVIVCPHIAAFTEESSQRAAVKAVENLLRILGDR